MKARRIGLITCANAAQELNCAMAVCMSAINKRTGTFSKYEEPVSLAGVVTCAGCPSLAYPEKILDKVRALTSVGITDIHLSNCMDELCPFVKKYIKLIEEGLPQVKLTVGSHVELISAEEFRQKVKSAFSGHRPMSDIINGKI